MAGIEDLSLLHVLAMLLSMLKLVVFVTNVDLAATSLTNLERKKLFETLEGFRLIGHVVETLAVDEFVCGLRCLRHRRCWSYNSHSDGNHGNATCELSDQRRQSSPDMLMRSPGYTYYVSLKGRDFTNPAHSCKDIRDSGDALGDGEYWIDPEKNGKPLKVYCDMTRADGGWLLVHNIVIEEPSQLPALSLETSYRKIDNYGSNNLVLSVSALKELWTHMPFTQMRFHCSKKQRRTFHIVTAANSTGQAVIQYFTRQTETKPDSCGSYYKLWDDNSLAKLAIHCADWGRENGNYHVGKWGHQHTRELYDHLVFIAGISHWILYRRWECDDFGWPGLSPGDFWKIFVRQKPDL